MPLDPQQKAVLDANAAIPQDPNATPAQRREAMKARPRPKGPPVLRTEDRFAPGPAGAIPIRLYTPSDGGPFPALVWFHGGGWVIGDIDMVDHTCRQLCNLAQCMIVSVDYRLAPEHKFPAPVDDCYAAVEWVAKNGGLFNIDTGRIAVGGDSAGGNLAAAVALMAKDKKGPRIVHQVLVYPVTNREFNTKSYSDNGVGYGLGKAGMVSFWDMYLRNDADAKNPCAAPLQAKDLKGLPPATVITAEFDPLRDEVNAYADVLRKAGVPVVNKTFEGVAHGFFNNWTMINKGMDAVKLASEELKKTFSRQPVGAR
jgi:acetyl esterase